MKLLQPHQLTYLDEVKRWLFFGAQIGQTYAVKSMAKPHNTEAFKAALDYFIYQDAGVIGGFCIQWTDEDRTHFSKELHMHNTTTNLVETGAVAPFSWEEHIADWSVEHLKPLLDYGG